MEGKCGGEAGRQGRDQGSPQDGKLSPMLALLPLTRRCSQCTRVGRYADAASLHHAGAQDGSQRSAALAPGWTERAITRRGRWGKFVMQLDQGVGGEREIFAEVRGAGCRANETSGSMAGEGAQDAAPRGRGERRGRGGEPGAGTRVSPAVRLRKAASGKSAGSASAWRASRGGSRTCGASTCLELRCARHKQVAAAACVQHADGAFVAFVQGAQTACVLTALRGGFAGGRRAGRAGRGCALLRSCGSHSECRVQGAGCEQPRPRLPDASRWLGRAALGRCNWCKQPRLGAMADVH